MRKIIPFNDNWAFAKPGQEFVPVTLPHTWNAVDGQDGGNDYWRGTAFYRKSFPKPELRDGERVFWECKGAGVIFLHNFRANSCGKCLSVPASL